MPGSGQDPPTVSPEEIAAARRRLDGLPDVLWTPVESSRSISEATGAEVYLKMEHLQRTGSFKIRGAFNKLVQVADAGAAERAIAASAGNHAQGVALAATRTGLDSTIVMPRTAPQAKIDATREYGAEVALHGRDFPEAMAHAKTLLDDASVFVHAYDDRDIVAGQGTLGLELLQDLPEVDVVVVPIGGGGLVSGVAAAIGENRPDVRIVGVQADGAATVPQSLKKGEACTIDAPRTVADGIATGGISGLTYAHIERYVDEVVTVSDDDISNAILFLLERTKQMVEGAGAVPVAALHSGAVDAAGERAMAVLSGGNLSTMTLQTVLTQALTNRHQLVRLRVRIRDEPGEMHTVSGLLAEFDANIRSVDHYRSIDDLAVGEAFLDFLVETSGEVATERIVESIRNADYAVTRLS